MLRRRRIAFCRAKRKPVDLHRSLRSLTPESPALQGRRLQRIRCFSTGDSGYPEFREERQDVARKFSPKWFHKMLDAHIAKLKSSHREKLTKSSNPLNLGETRWEEEEKYQMAPWDGKQSRGKDLRRLGEENGQWQRRIRGRGGDRR
jgi:hypothetical protein